MPFVKQLSLPVGLCLVSSAVLAQGLSIRPLVSLPDVPGHGFYISTIEMVPDNFTGKNPSYTAKVIIDVKDLPGFVSKSQPIQLDIKHIKPGETMGQIQAEAKQLADTQIDLIVKTLQDYKSDFDKNRQ